MRGIGGMRRAMLVAGFCFATALFLEIASGQAVPQTVEVTYLANEGFLIQSGNKKILIDALFRGELAPYAGIPGEWREKLETAKAPFDAVDLVLVSHVHSDHFDAASVARHLAHNPHAILVSSPQVVEKVRAMCDDAQDIAGELLKTAGKKTASGLYRVAPAPAGCGAGERPFPGGYRGN